MRPRWKAAGRQQNQQSSAAEQVLRLARLQAEVDRVDVHRIEQARHAQPLAAGLDPPQEITKLGLRHFAAAVLQHVRVGRDVGKRCAELVSHRRDEVRP